jgi:hypothetical protein
VEKCRENNHQLPWTAVIQNGSFIELGKRRYHRRRGRRWNGWPAAFVTAEGADHSDDTQTTVAE